MDHLMTSNLWIFKIISYICKMYIIITDKGFLTTKEKPESTDTIICEAPTEECDDIIHGKGKKPKTKSDEKFHN